MKVALLTMFNGLDSTYSLVNVVSEHLKMLLNSGIQTKLLVSEDCPDDEKYGIYLDQRIEWIKITNRLGDKQIKWFDYSKPDGIIHNTFFEEAETIALSFITNLSDVDICIMHDIHYQGWHLVHNVAIRRAQESLPNLRFIAMTHSVPQNKPIRTTWPFSARYSPMKNTIYAYPTQSGIPALAKQYDVPEGRCSVINNSLDLIGKMSIDIKSINQNFELLSCDILIVYPGRLSFGKKFEKVADFAGVIRKTTELHVKVVFCDFPSMDIDSKIYKKLIKKTGIFYGLEESNIAFTSDMGYPDGFPHDGVFELFLLSNLFICPSYSESFGLTVLEAASRGNFLVLNQAVPALEELGKKLNSYFIRWDARNFGYDTKENYKPSEQAYFEEHARIVVNLIRENSILYAKTMTRIRFSPQWVWHNQLEPLINLK